jgi:LacI family transcriptional regulator
MSNEKSLTIKDVAKKAGVSTATVGRVIGNYGKVSRETRNKVMNAVNELGYFPSEVARNFKKKSTNSIGVIVGNIGNAFFSEMISSIESVARQSGYNILITNTNESIDVEIDALEAFYKNRVAGLIIATAQNDGVYKESLNHLYNGKIPTVYVDRKLRTLNNLCVTTDNFSGAYEATKYLLELGHTKIGVIAGVKSSPMLERVEGYKRALANYGINYDPKLVKFSKVATPEEGLQLSKMLFEGKVDFTALFVLNNSLFTGSILYLSEQNIKIPDDISLVSWDDFLLAKVWNPPITLVTQDIAKMGEIATTKLLEMIKAKENDESWLGETQIILKSKLIVRESCLKKT